MAPPSPSPSLESLLAHSEWLASLARRLSIDRATADDLVQDTWVAALRNPPREAHSLRAWLASVARRLARVSDPLRGRAGAFARADSPPTDEVVARIEQERLLARLVLELEEPYRKVVLQRFYAGLSAARIARIESVPDATVRTRVRRALALLRERLERENGNDGRGWPLASFLLLPGKWAPGATQHGVLLMSTKSTIAIGVAVGALCALTVTEGILPRLADKPDPTVASMVAAHGPATLESNAVADQAAGSHAAVSAPDSLRPVAAARTEAVPEGEPFLSLTELRQLLSSSSRLDQIRAIELLLQMRTLEANAVLLETLLTTADPILLALLEEGLLRSPLDIAPAVMGAFDASKDPKAFARLAGMLAKLAAKHPSLQQEVAKLFVGKLNDAWLDPDQASSISAALVALGAGALDQLAAYVADLSSNPEGAGAAAGILAQLAPEHADALRAKLTEGFDAFQAVLNDPDSGEAEKSAVLKKTGSLAWAASLRPAAEHDSLGDMLVDHLIRTHDESQAGTLTWGIANLKGLSDDARLRITRTILDSVAGQTNSSISYAYVSTVNQLLTSNPNRPLDSNFHDAVRLVEDALYRNGQDPAASSRLQWLLSQLHAYEQKQQ